MKGTVIPSIARSAKNFVVWFGLVFVLTATLYLGGASLCDTGGSFEEMGNPVAG
jgi:hypothetical protein